MTGSRPAPGRSWASWSCCRAGSNEAPALLAGALEVSLAARSTQFVAMCLVGYAWLAFADGDLDRAARLEGSAEGLRQRVGLPAWPHLRKKEAELVAQLRQRLGASQFDQAFSAGSQLTQQQAVAIVQGQPQDQPQEQRAEPPADLSRPW